MHADIIAHQSEPLRILLRGDMKEAIESKVTWAETSVDTFLLFSQYAYTGDYSVTKAEDPVKDEEIFSDEQAKPVPSNAAAHAAKTRVSKIAADGWHDQNNNFKAFSTDKQEKARQRWGKIWENMVNLYPEPDMQISIHHAPTEVPINTQPEALLHHARLYIFADYHNITNLQRLARYKIGQAFRSLPDTKGWCVNFFDLIVYCYANTMCIGKGDNSLRKLIAVYAAHHVDVFWEWERFGEVIEEVGEFGRDLMREVLALKKGTT